MKVNTEEFSKPKKFYIALAISGLQLKEFAALQGVKRKTVYDILYRDRPSKRLNAAIDAFTAEQFVKFEAMLRSASSAA